MRDDYKPFFKSIQVFYNKRLFSFVLKDFPRDCLNIAYASQYVYYKAKTNYYEVLKVNIKRKLIIISCFFANPLVSYFLDKKNRFGEEKKLDIHLNRSCDLVDYRSV